MSVDPWGQQPWGHNLRIGDAEREAAVAALGEHFTTGRLSQDEYDERITRAWAAKTDLELAPLFNDLPQPHAVPARQAPQRGGASLMPPPPPRGRRSNPIPWIALVLGVVLVSGATHVPWFLIALIVVLVLYKRSSRR